MFDMVDRYDIEIKNINLIWKRKFPKQRRNDAGQLCKFECLHGEIKNSMLFIVKNIIYIFFIPPPL